MKLSIIIPIYNSEKYLRECIESILKQTFKDFELILRDDGSTDGSDEICDEYKMRNDNIKVVHKSNKGQARRRNDGIGIAAGDYILMVDSDDMIEPDMCSTMISYIKKSNAKVVVITNDKSFDFGFEPNYIIEIGDSKYKKTGKHNLLTTMELMSLRYYSIYYPDVKDNIIE